MLGQYYDLFRESVQDLFSVMIHLESRQGFRSVLLFVKRVSKGLDQYYTGLFWESVERLDQYYDSFKKSVRVKISIMIIHLESRKGFRSVL